MEDKSIRKTGDALMDAHDAATKKVTHDDPTEVLLPVKTTIGRYDGAP